MEYRDWDWNAPEIIRKGIISWEEKDKIIPLSGAYQKLFSMANLELFRVSEYANRVRDINVLVNGEVIGVISNGETKIFDIPEGDNQVQVKIDWCTSKPISFNIGENETKRLTMSSFAKHNPLGTLAAIYYITFASNKYLQLEEQ